MYILLVLNKNIVRQLFLFDRNTRYRITGRKKILKKQLHRNVNINVQSTQKLSRCCKNQSINQSINAHHFDKI